jgi:hypothetical protein
MANFPTHLVGAAVGSTAVAALLAHMQTVSLPRALLLVGVGTVGGLLPDIDSDHSIPARWVRGAVATALGLLAVSSLWITHPPLAALAMGACVWIASYAIGEHVVARFTVHRGIVHSIPFALLCAFSAAIAAHRLVLLPPVEAWWIGAFLGAGFVVHLALDEIASVDISSVRIKRSFGTALKLWDPNNTFKTLLVYGLLAAVLSELPAVEDFALQARALWLTLTTWIAALF